MLSFPINEYNTHSFNRSQEKKTKDENKFK